MSKRYRFKGVEVRLTNTSAAEFNNKIMSISDEATLRALLECAKRDEDVPVTYKNRIYSRLTRVRRDRERAELEK